MTSEVVRSCKNTYKRGLYYAPYNQLSTSKVNRHLFRAWERIATFAAVSQLKDHPNGAVVYSSIEGNELNELVQQIVLSFKNVIYTLIRTTVASSFGVCRAASFLTAFDGGSFDVWFRSVCIIYATPKNANKLTSKDVWCCSSYKYRALLCCDYS